MEEANPRTRPGEERGVGTSDQGQGFGLEKSEPK